jgi:predicted porin
MTDAHATGLSGSRWGLRGSEDLGGGLKTIFVLENGFMANTGVLAQGGAEFGRQAYVGLVSSSLGTLTIGRQYDPYLESLQPLSAPGTFAGYMGSHPDDVDNLSNTNRVNNAIKFSSNRYAGFSAEGMYSLGGVAGSVGTNQIWSLGGSYANGLVSAGVGYLNARDPNVSFYGNTPNKGVATVDNIGSLGSASAAQSNPVYAGYASAKTLQLIGAGLALNFSGATVAAIVTDTRFSGLGATSAPNPRGYRGDTSFLSAELSVRSYVTPALLLGAAFDYTRRSAVQDDGGAKYLQLDFGAICSLSKRTDVYALTVLQHASGVDSIGQQAVASVSGFSPSTTDRQIGVRAGIRHRF